MKRKLNKRLLSYVGLVIAFVAMSVVLIYNTTLLAKYNSTGVGSDSAKVAKFDVSITNYNNNINKISLGGIEDNPSEKYEFQLTNSSEVSVKVQFVISFTTSSNEPTTLLNDLEVYVVDKNDSTNIFEKKIESTDTSYIFDLDDMDPESVKDYYLTFAGGLHGSITSKQTVYINAQATLTQIN